MTEKRLEVLLKNALTYLSTEFLDFLKSDEKLSLLKDELGFTDEEIEELRLEEEVFGKEN